MLPEHIAAIKNKSNLYFETGYGEIWYHTDEEYKSAGANVVSRDEVMNKDVICDPKIGDTEYLSELRNGQTIFGELTFTPSGALDANRLPETDLLLGQFLKLSPSGKNEKYK